MCGIYGMVSLDGRPLPRRDLLDAMGTTLKHRGPDGHGTLTADDAAFGAARLRIIDLDPRADQPFVDPDGQVWLCCNGEIYNAPDLRREFSDYPFRTRSDCEVILPLVQRGGAAALERLEGMFALAIWDRPSRTLTLARDPAGEKPLFYAQIGGEVWFASEIPALLSCPGVSRDIDAAALGEFLRWGYVMSPRTMFRGVRQVRAGSIHTFDARGFASRAYWNPASAVTGGRPTGAANVQELRDLLQAAVTRQMAADVPIGVFLSGGVDSATIAALAARAQPRVRTFSIGFAAASFDETAPAERTARYLGVPHTTVRIGEPELRQALDAFASGMAEPIADPALLPTYLLSRVAREHVSVVLGGEGADELFGGYPTYLAHRLAGVWRRLPRQVRAALVTAVSAIPATHRRMSLSYLLRRFVAGADLPWPARHAAWVGTGLPAELNGALVAVEDPGEDIVRSARLLDFTTYLRDDLLVKLDRSTMRVGLEARAPYLDRRVAAFALALPPDQVFRGFRGKWLLREAAGAWLPRSVTHRTKRGLSVPVSAWINGRLSGEVDRLLEPGRLSRQGVLDHLSVARLLEAHRRGTADHGRALWALIILQLWFERFGGGSG